MLIKTKTIEFAMSGTLGDAFTVFCKLAGYHQSTGNNVRLYRYTVHPEFDGAISAFFGVVPYVEYITPCFNIRWSGDKLADCEKMVAPYISARWNGCNVPVFPDDPAKVYFEPYPELEIQPVSFSSKKYRIGIQLHTGKVEGNFKGFSLRWISRLRKWLPENEFEIYLLGTGQGYSLERLQRFCRRRGIVNLVGKTEFTEWIVYISSMDFFITPEGFSAFFAMSQKVRSLVFYTDYQILARIHPKWRRENIIISAGQKDLYGRLVNHICRQTIKQNRLFAPIKPEQVWSLIYGERAYL